MRLVLVRHGQTSSNRSGALDTSRPGASLDATGMAQAEALAQRWEDEVSPPPTLLAVSPLLRTRQTVHPLERRYGLHARVSPGIREIRAGDLEMNADPMSVVHYLRTMSAWAAGDLDVRMPGAEDGHVLLRRALGVVESVRRDLAEQSGPDPTGVIVAHGAVIRALTPHLADNVPAQLVEAHPMGNALTTVLEWRGDRFHALTWSDRRVEEWDVPTRVDLAEPSELEPVRRA
ncbi:MAG: histidine phosphatase family protein [Propionibacterium sp.]|nr:histidine phosphatase family protein [Propionibacterium sp.]